MGAFSFDFRVDGRVLIGLVGWRYWIEVLPLTLKLN
jgi:hypothetical protein